MSSSRAPAARVDQPWRSGSRGGGTESGCPGRPSTSDITVASPHQRGLANSTPVLRSEVSVVSRVGDQAPAAGIRSQDQDPSRRAPPPRELYPSPSPTPAAPPRAPLPHPPRRGRRTTRRAAATAARKPPATAPQTAAKGSAAGCHTPSPSIPTPTEPACGSWPRSAAICPVLTWGSKIAS